MEGWIKLHRQLSENPIWLSEKFTDGQAWVDLLLLANYKQNFIKVRGIRIDIEMGECGYSELTLSERWKWSRGKVRRFIDFLKQQNMIKINQQNNHVTTIISITNYKNYQLCDTTNSTSNNTTDEQQIEQQTDTNNNVKKEKKLSKSKDLLLSEKIDFDKLMNYWNKNTKMALITAITETRKRAIMARCKEHGKDSIYKVVNESFNNKFLNGSNENNWIASFDWIFKPTNFIKVLEGNYKNGTNQRLTVRSSQTRQQIGEAAADLAARLG